ncbi:MAG: hypothetical protein WKF58_18555 [Ilumatobacteraceae bacterium]
MQTGDLVPNAVAAAIGLAEQGSMALEEVILAGLAARQQLLIVDNCEGLLDACAPLIDAILRRCPQITVLTTSREPLGVDGETTWRVPSLTLPAPGRRRPPRRTRRTRTPARSSSIGPTSPGPTCDGRPTTPWR